MAHKRPSKASVCLGIASAPDGIWIGGPRYSQVDTIVALLCATEKLDIILSGGIPALPDWASFHTDILPAWHPLPYSEPLMPLVDRQFPVRLYQWMRDAIRMRAFLKDVGDLRPDVLWVEGVEAHRNLERYRSWNPKCRVMTFRGSPDQVSGRFGGVDQLNRVREEMSTYDGLVFVSSRVGEMWRAFPELKDKHIYYLPNCAREEELQGLMTRNRDALREKLGLPKDRLIGICLGSVQWRKGQQVLAEAMPGIVSQLPDICFLLVGEIWNGGGGALIRESFNPFLKGGHVRFLGPTKDALQYLYASDFMIQPSLEEAMPLAVLEAMVLGVPVAASTAGGIPELVEHNRTGLLFSPNNADDLNDAVIQMGADSRHREEWAQAGQVRYWKKFSRACQIDRYYHALDEILAV